jgi:hypothetical protein
LLFSALVFVREKEKLPLDKEDYPSFSCDVEGHQGGLYRQMAICISRKQNPAREAQALKTWGACIEPRHFLRFFWKKE